MTSAVLRWIAGLTLLVGYLLGASLPARAQTLNVPVASHVRPIQTATLLHELCADFFPEKELLDRMELTGTLGQLLAQHPKP